MIVFDSSTIILLAKTEILDLILDNYKKEIMIPKAVEKESTRKQTFDALLIKKRIEENKIEVKTIQDKTIEKIMVDFNINHGEAEAIVLALQKNCLLATDDKNAINACKLLKIPFTTAIDILIRASQKELLTKEESHSKLSELSKYGRYKKEIINDAKRRLI